MTHSVQHLPLLCEHEDIVESLEPMQTRRSSENVQLLAILALTGGDRRQENN